MQIFINVCLQYQLRVKIKSVVYKIISLPPPWGWGKIKDPELGGREGKRETKKGEEGEREGGVRERSG